MKLKKPLNLILASTRKLGIGFENDLPWPRIKQDMQYFKRVTTQQGRNSVIMGFKTFESMKFNNLPGRMNIILTNKSNKVTSQYKNEENYFFNDLDEALLFLEEQEVVENYVIGGTQIFHQVLEKYQIDKLYWTRIYQKFQCDKFIDQELFESVKKRLKNQYVSKTISQGNVNFDFCVYGNHNKQNRMIKQKSQEYQYTDLLKKILEQGKDRGDRTGTGIRGLFGNSMRFDLSQTFPLLTTKKVFFRGVVEELIWFLKGQTDGNILKDKGVHIWDGNGSREFLDKKGLDYREMDLGPVYGFQWRHFGAKYKDCDTDYTGQGVDQIQQLIEGLKNDPYSRRHLVCAWNPSDINKMALPPCHTLFQFYVENDNRLSCSLYQRSCDVGLGLPFNIASYSLLVCLIADHLKMKRGEFIHFIGDTHIYQNHIQQLEKQYKRKPRPFPLLNINTRSSIDDYTFEDFKLTNYFPHKKIDMKMAIQLFYYYLILNKFQCKFCLEFFNKFNCQRIIYFFILILSFSFNNSNLQFSFSEVIYYILIFKSLQLFQDVCYVSVNFYYPSLINKIVYYYQEIVPFKFIIYSYCLSFYCIVSLMFDWKL